jgi:NAD-dependent dihydropyrimidine dehydrogenase PreA subunit
MKDFRYLKGVTTLSLDSQNCIGCRMCTLVCPHGVLSMEGKKARIVDLDGCMECGACAANCPVAALQVNPGVGCAAYIIQTWIKKDKSQCACC